jgi:hypothetical protein
MEFYSADIEMFMSGWNTLYIVEAITTIWGGDTFETLQSVFQEWMR